MHLNPKASYDILLFSLLKGYPSANHSREISESFTICSLYSLVVKRNKTIVLKEK